MVLAEAGLIRHRRPGLELPSRVQRSLHGSRHCKSILQATSGGLLCGLSYVPIRSPDPQFCTPTGSMLSAPDVGAWVSAFRDAHRMQTPAFGDLAGRHSYEGLGLVCARCRAGRGGPAVAIDVLVAISRAVPGSVDRPPRSNCNHKVRRTHRYWIKLCLRSPHLASWSSGARTRPGMPSRAPAAAACIRPAVPTICSSIECCFDAGELAKSRAAFAVSHRSHTCEALQPGYPSMEFPLH